MTLGDMMRRDLDSDVDEVQMTHSPGDGCEPPHTMPGVEPAAGRGVVTDRYMTESEFDIAVLAEAKAIAERELDALVMPVCFMDDLSRLARRIAARQEEV